MSQMLTCETLASMHTDFYFFLNNFFRKLHTCARLAPATQHELHVRTLTCRKPPGVVLWVICVEADLHLVYCCLLCCTLSDRCFLHITTRYWLMYSSIVVHYFACNPIYLVRTYVSHITHHASRITLRAMLTWNTLVEHAYFSYIFLSQTHSRVPDFLPLPIHQRHVCTYCLLYTSDAADE